MNPDRYALALLADQHRLEGEIAQRRQAVLHKKAVARRRKAKKARKH